VIEGALGSRGPDNNPDVRLRKLNRQSFHVWGHVERFLRKISAPEVITE
jgi:hypothetical protein